tara:strand:- start:1710 stop:1901 length:192 start_codon:yes stop_codon:yes gene_type:complete
LNDLYVGFESAGFCSVAAPSLPIAVSWSTTIVSSSLAFMVAALFVWIYSKIMVLVMVDIDEIG